MHQYLPIIGNTFQQKSLLYCSVPFRLLISNCSELANFVIGSRASGKKNPLFVFFVPQNLNYMCVLYIYLYVPIQKNKNFSREINVLKMFLSLHVLKKVLRKFKL